MKKLLLLSTLIVVLPFTANATDPIGPSAVPSGGTPVVATASAPYATATEETGDTTNVVSASYVKGAYNDTIAAINKLNNKLNNTLEEKQDILATYGDHQRMQQSVYGKDETVFMLAYVDEYNLDEAQWQNYDQLLISTSGVVAGIKSQRVTAVDTWGSPHTVDLGLKTAAQ